MITKTVIFVTVAAIIGSLIIVFLIIRSINTPIKKVVNAANEHSWR